MSFNRYSYTQHIRFGRVGVVRIRCQAGYSSERTASKILDESDVVVTPGNGFGPSGEGYIRATLTVECERLAEAAERMAAVDW